jgi:hypothetical protein
MKQLILFTLLLITGSLLGSQHKIINYASVPRWSINANNSIRRAAALSAAAAKFTIYEFEEFVFYPMVVYKTSNYECSFYIRFNRDINQCMVEFNADNATFNYEAFKKVMDSFFLYD